MKTAYCFDLDGTVTNVEILPEIAKGVFLYDELSLLTKLTMQGLIDFKMSFKLRVRLLSAIKNQTIVDIIDKIPLNLKIVNFIKNNKNNCFIVTNNLDCWVIDFIKKYIGCSFFSSKSIVNGDYIVEIKENLNKGDAICKIKQKFDRVIVIGDGYNDLSMFEKGDIGISCGIVHEPASIIKDISDYIIYSENALCHILKQL